MSAFMEGCREIGITYAPATSPTGRRLYVVNYRGVDVGYVWRTMLRKWACSTSSDAAGARVEESRADAASMLVYMVARHGSDAARAAIAAAEGK